MTMHGRSGPFPETPSGLPTTPSSRLCLKINFNYFVYQIVTAMPQSHIPWVYGGFVSLPRISAINEPLGSLHATLSVYVRKFLELIDKVAHENGGGP